MGCRSADWQTGPKVLNQGAVRFHGRLASKHLESGL